MVSPFCKLIDNIIYGGFAAWLMWIYESLIKRNDIKLTNQNRVSMCGGTALTPTHPNATDLTAHNCNGYFQCVSLVVSKTQAQRNRNTTATQPQRFFFQFNND